MTVEVQREEILWVALERSIGEKWWVADNAIPALFEEVDMLVFV